MSLTKTAPLHKGHYQQALMAVIMKMVLRNSSCFELKAIKAKWKIPGKPE